MLFEIIWKEFKDIYSITIKALDRRMALDIWRGDYQRKDLIVKGELPKEVYAEYVELIKIEKIEIE